MVTTLTIKRARWVAGICLLFAGLTPALGWAAGSGQLTYIDIYDPGFFNPRWVEISSDGQFVYAVDRGNDVFVFSRDAGSGALTFLQNAVSGSAGGDQIRFRISPDDKHIYSASLGDASLAVYERNLTTGELTHLETEIDGVGGVTGLDPIVNVAVAPDGAHVYAVSNLSHQIAVFARDAGTGLLTFVTSYMDGVGGVSGLDTPQHVVVSPDGAHVYVTGMKSVVFARDSGTGLLTQIQMVDVNGEAVTVSGDGRNVYLGRTVYARNESTGTITPIQTLAGSEMGFSESFDFSSDGAYLYSTNHIVGSVWVHGRSPIDGTLTPLQHIRFGDAQDLAMEHVTAAVLSPDNKHLYATAHISKTLLAFDRGASSTAIVLTPQNVVEEGTRIEMEAPGGFSYQWLRDGGPLAEDGPRVTGTDGPFLVIDPAEVGDTAVYTVRYDNGSGLVTSDPVYLSVHTIGSLPVAGTAVLAVLVGLLAAGLWWMVRRPGPVAVR